MDEIFKHKDFTITEEVMDMESSTDTANRIIIHTKEDEFIFDFAYGELLNFVRCKKYQ